MLHRNHSNSIHTLKLYTKTFNSTHTPLKLYTKTLKLYTHKPLKLYTQTSITHKP